MSDIQTFQQMVSLLLSPDNNQRTQAEQQLNQLANSNAENFLNFSL